MSSRPEEGRPRAFDPQVSAAIREIYASYNRVAPGLGPLPDDQVRHPEYTARLLCRLGRPDLAFSTLLVAGSKGKGSTSFYASRLLGARGLRVGLFTGPHLIDFRERIRVDGRAISDSAFLAAFARLRPELERLLGEISEGTYVGPVGIAAVLAALHFARAGVTHAVFECGRGARYDDVAQLAHEGAVITRLLPEHPRQLGPDIGRIAWHKAGAIGRGVRYAVAADAEGEPRRRIEEEARAHGARLLLLGRDVEVTGLHAHPGGIAFAVRTVRARYEGLTLPTLGEYQAENAALALAAVEEMCGPLPPEEARRALAGARWPGRLELVCTSPPVLVDGCIHRSSAAPLARWLRRGPRPRVAVVGVPEDKDWAGVIRALAPASDLLILTRVDAPHLAFPADALVLARSLGEAMETASVEEALDAALARAGAVALAGTQSVVARALAYFGRDLLDLS